MKKRQDLFAKEAFIILCDEVYRKVFSHDDFFLFEEWAGLKDWLPETVRCDCGGHTVGSHSDWCSNPFDMKRRPKGLDQ